MQLMLPEGSARDERRDFEQINIPPPRLEDAPNLGPLVQIKDTDELIRAGFAGVRELNRIQSVVFPQAYKTSENLLICAPTGAGKTNIAMLAVLEVIRRHWKVGTDISTIRRDDFKVIKMFYH
jgi:replicative superfamily II helicase